MVTDVTYFQQTQHRRFLSVFQLRTEIDQVPRMLCSLEYRAMDKVKELSNLKCYTASPEPLTIKFKDSLNIYFLCNINIWN